MSITETYLFLFTDAFVSGLVLPAKHALVLPVMLAFGGYNLYCAGLISTLGITIAACLNWLLGRALRSLKKDIPNSPPHTPDKMEKILGLLKIHGYWSGIFGFVPVLGPILTVSAGAVQTSFIRTIALVFTVNLASALMLAATH